MPADIDDDSSINTPSEGERDDDLQDEDFDPQTEDYDASDADQYENEEDNDMRMF